MQIPVKSKINLLIVTLILIHFSLFGQNQILDFNSISFKTSDKEIIFPNQQFINNYLNQKIFEIIPDYELTSSWIKAGAYFRYNNKDAIADQVIISVYLPTHSNGWEYKEYSESYVDNPEWSDWRQKLLNNDFFYFSIKAKYGEIWYEQTFKAEPKKLEQITCIIH